MDGHRSQRERGRDTSPAKICSRLKQKPAAAATSTRVVQVVYYLSRNGLLEHPHFIELTLSPNQPLRLKDVFDRLMVLRGSDMPLQYSWSSKRNYKSGYVWHDLALKDIIHPAEGEEYVLKGSELVHGCSERFQQLNVSNKQAIVQLPSEPNCSHHNPKHKALNSGPHTRNREPEEYEEYELDEGKVYEEGEKTRSCTSANTSSTCSTTPQYSRCSRGVSTDELLDNKEEDKDKDARTSTRKVIRNKNQGVHAPNNINPKRLIGDPLTDQSSARSSRPHSVLVQLIACGTSALELKAKHKPKPRLSNVNVGTNKVFSEDPRLHKCEEPKEYFSGSLVESVKVLDEAEPVLNRSNSYNEQRRSKLGMEEPVKLKVTEEDKNDNKG